MMTFKDDILMTIFGGGTLDYEMLEKCNYDFEDIYNYMRSFTTLEEADFNDILIGAIDLYRYNIQNKIDELMDETNFRMEELQEYKDNGTITKEEDEELLELEEKSYELKCIYTTDDIEYNTNYLDTQIWVADDDIKAIYKKYLSKEIDEENDKIGFVALDLE